MSSGYTKLVEGYRGGGLDDDDIELEGSPGQSPSPAWRAARHATSDRWPLVALGVLNVVLCAVVLALSATLLHRARGPLGAAARPDFRSSAAAAAPGVSRAGLARELADRLDLDLPTCSALFPLHDVEIERTRQWAERAGGVSLAEVDRLSEPMHARVVVKDGRVYVRRRSDVGQE